MPLKFNVGLTKKMGLPDYGSVGASCHVEVELEGSLAEGDLERLNAHVRRAYVACAQAVNEELARHSAASNSPTNGASSSSNGAAANGRSTSSARRSNFNPRQATQSQVRAIQAIAERQNVDLAGLLHERFAADEAAALSITQASQLIDELKQSANAGKRR
jgi:hypothetical protein